MLDQIKGFHIEPTNMCTLKCPQCARTNFIETFPNNWHNKNLNLEHLKSFLDIELMGKNINLCGNYGDSIYYDQLFEMLEFFKEKGCSIRLATNGSYRTIQWWEELNQILTADDEIVFALDGLPDNFTKYRVNADWESIKDGINVVNKGSVKLSWQYILFSYNESSVDQARKLSKELGFDNFFVLDSDRWDNGTKWFTPSTVGQINASKIKWKQNIKYEIDTKCKNLNNQHFISADGYYLPCCYVGDYRFYYKTEFYKNRDLYDISKTTITEVLTHLRDFYSTLEDAKLNYCTFNCPKL